VDRIRLYTPAQVMVGSFVGGPFAAVYMLWMNFRALGEEAAARRTLIWGAVFVVAVFAVLPMLPANFPNYVMPVIYSLGARLVAERFHLTKQALRPALELERPRRRRRFPAGLHRAGGGIRHRARRDRPDPVVSPQSRLD